MDGLLLFRLGFQNREGADSLPLRVKIRARTLKVRELGDDYLIGRPAWCVNDESGASSIGVAPNGSVSKSIIDAALAHVGASTHVLKIAKPARSALRRDELQSVR